MCRLKIKIKITGSKHHKFKKLIILPRNYFISAKFKKKLGIIDTRTNNKTSRYIIINIYILLNQYKLGLTPNKKSLNILYYFFIKSKDLNSNSYFSVTQSNLF
jgi:hypothetical protein